MSNLSPRQVALRAGDKWYRPTVPCAKCKGLSLRYVANGRCSTCSSQGEPVFTERQMAVALGEKWFTPLEPHVTCGIIAPRYVANGRCKACQGLGDVERLVMAMNPCDRATAVLLGAQVFRRDDGCWQWTD